MASQSRPASRAFMEAFTTDSTWTRGWRWGGRSRGMRVLRTRMRRKTRTTNDGQMDRMGGVSTAHPPSVGQIPPSRLSDDQALQRLAVRRECNELAYQHAS